ncbi:hypothetical protein GCM10023212_15030 [Luteolibacter yonseiensis]
MGTLRALDAPPPPDPKTMEWTMKQAAYIHPVFDIENTEASWIIATLDDSSMTTPGFYLNIDKSQVEDRLARKLTFRVKEISWLAVLAKVADALDAEIRISPGKFTLVPREDEEATGSKKRIRD